MIILPAFAKLNLALEVTGRAADGLHTLASVVVRIDWHDLVGIGSNPGDVSTMVRLTGRTAGIPADSTNLAARAGAAVATLAGMHPPAVWLHKRVPAAAGLGGGSADAAAAMTATMRLLERSGASVASDDLQRAAAALGSDVPALLAGGAQLVRGTGDDLEALPTPRMCVVVVFAAPASTPAAYAALTEAERRGDGRVAALATQLRTGEAPDQSLFGSALEAPALRANLELAAAVSSIRTTWASVRWHMTGSGGALFAVTESDDEARRLARDLAAAAHVVGVCRTVGN